MSEPYNIRIIKLELINIDEYLYIINNIKLYGDYIK